MSFRFRTLGGIALDGPEGPVAGRAAQPRRLAVLSLLAAAPDRTVLRDQVVGCIWPDTEQARARHLLSDAVYVLRQALGDDALLSRGNEELRLNEELVWTDVGSFEAAVEAGDLESAANLYAGEFLAGFHLSGAPGFERWQEKERRRLGSMYAEGLERLARKAEDDGDAKAAVRWWKKRAAHDPFDSRIAHALMSALAAAGNPAGALRHARVHELMLRDELGLEPSDEVMRLVGSLRAATGGGADDGVSDVRPARADGEPEADGDRAPVGPGRSTPAQLDDAEAVGARPGTPAGGSGLPPGKMTDSPRWTAAGTAALLAVGVGASLLLGGSGSSDYEALPRRGILAAFENHTSRPNLGRAVTEAVRVDLSQSDAISVVEPSLVTAVLERMERDAGEGLDLETAREVAIREGVQTVVGGEVHPAGSGYVLTGKVIEAETGRILAGLRETAAGEDELLGAMDRLSKELRERIGEPVASVRAAEPLPRATTRSLEALEAYARAVEMRNTGGRFGTAKRLLEEALALDSTFALAYRELSVLLYTLNRDPAGSVLMARKAYEHRDGLPDRERLFVEGWYHMQVTGDHEKARAAFEALLERHPDHQPALLRLASLYGKDRLEEARALYERAIRLDSLSSFVNYLYLMGNLMDQGDFEAAWRVQEAQERHFGVRHLERGWIAAAEGDYERALREQRLALKAAKDDVERAVAQLRLAFYAATVGRMRDAEEATRASVAAALRAGHPRGAHEAAVQQARVDLVARRDTAGALARVGSVSARRPLAGLEPVDRLYFPIAGIYAQAGRTDRALELLREERGARDPEWRPEYRARHRRCVRALVALAEGRPEHAIAGLRALEGTGSWGWGPCPRVLPPRPVTGFAHEAAGRPDSAIVQYERFLSHPSQYRDWWNPVYQADVLERLAVLYEEEGSHADAVEIWSRLAALWKGADPELRPRVERARASSLALRGDGESMGQSASGR